MVPLLYGRLVPRLQRGLTLSCWTVACESGHGVASHVKMLLWGKDLCINNTISTTNTTTSSVNICGAIVRRPLH